MKKYNEKGISLIALVITIIVIIILAGAVIITLSNGGIMDSSKKARFMSDFKNVEEGVNLYSVSNIDISGSNSFKLPLEGKLSLSDKQDIANNVPTLKTKIEELNPGKTINDIDLYWINEADAGVKGLASNKKDKGYVIDVATNQIYDYVGDFFETKRWHTLDGGVTEIAVVPDTQELWNGWINLTLYYPTNSTAKMWRLGNEGEIRVDPMLMWQEYTGPISIPLDRVKDVWIKYKINNEDVIVPPAGTLLVDIVPDKTGTTKVSEVNVNINYDSDATTKEYKVGNSDWMPYIGGFAVTENCLIQARAKKTEKIYNTDGTLLVSRDIVGKDLVYIGNIGVEETNLAAPVIKRLPPAAGDEKARLQITYPENAVRKIFKINYGVEQNYTSEVSIKSYGTHIIAYYYDVSGKKSLSTSIYINDTTVKAAEDPKPYEALPPYVPEVPLPYEPDTKIKLPPPIITRLDASNGSEKARIQITYPSNADRKIFTQNYGVEQNYVNEISVTTWGTYIMAYYYDVDGNKSQIAWIRVNEIPTEPGVLEPVPIEPSEIVPAPVININPNSGLVSEVSVSVTSPAGATVTYLKIGRYGTYHEYTAPIVVRDNVELYAYYRNSAGEKSLEAHSRITNILKNDDGTANKKPYVYINANPYPWSGAAKSSEVVVNIASSYADKVEYSNDGIVYNPYTTPFVVKENKRIYARATNAYGVSEAYLDITNIGAIKVPDAIEILAVNINVDPEPSLSTSKVASAKVSIEYDSKATEKYYSIGKYGDLKTYTVPFDITSSCTIYAYAKSKNGKGETSKVIDNLLIGISNPVIVPSPSNSIQASKVGINITYDKYATIKKYSINGSALTDYTVPFDITTNGTTVYAYSENSSGEKSSSSYTVENIIPPPPVLALDKGNYYLLKLSYPEGSNGREYKWKENGDWKSYKEAGILLIKPEFKDSVIKNGTLIKIEDENGKLLTFEGDYYLIDVPISQLFANISMRWDRVAPLAPQIVINPIEPTKQVTATIVYDTEMVKKQYRILQPGGTLGDWLNYNGPITIDRNNTIIYAKAMDNSEVWSQEAMLKVTNIDEVAPVIKLTADLTSVKQSVAVKVDVTDDVAVGIVKWAPGTQGESYFTSNGVVIANNSNVNITENGYYTFYAEDQVGNKQVYTLNVENIDVLPPENPILSAAPTSWTKGSVTVTIVYSESSVIKEYSTNGTSWQTYVNPIVITNNNTTVYAKAKDEAGNQSGQSTLTVSNIDKVNPVVGFSTNGANNVETASTTVTVTDTDGSGVDASTLQYVWDVQNMTTPTSGWVAFTNSSLITKTGVEGTYYLWVKGTDNAGNTVVSKTNAFVLAIQVVVNKPLLAPGMTAKIWNSSSNTWDTVTNPDTDTTWYNYAGKEWANAQTADGSMWVWIPRYVYKISSGWHQTTNTGVINIQFSKGIDDNWNSPVIGAINTSNLATASNNIWTNHPAFTFGTQELTGIWVAKFAASGTSSAIDSKPGGTMLDAYNIGRLDGTFTAVRNMEVNSRYGWGTSGERVDTHMIKNTEWGAVAYLSKSSYGKNTVEISINPSTSYYAGGGTGISYISNGAQSTTGNVHGVYDMSAMKYTFIAAYLNDNSNGYLAYAPTMINANAKYRDMYSITDIYSATSKKGDAFYETSSNYSGNLEWFGNFIDKPYSYSPFFMRGGYYYSTYKAGIFSLENTYSNENGIIRPIIVVAPEEPKVTVNPTSNAPEVTATIAYEQGSVERKYRILEPGGTLGNWLDYTGPFIVNKNTTIIYAKALDQNGFWSPETTYTVTNISPINPIMSASPTGLTSGNVTVTITYSSDVTTKQYSLNGTTWLTYTSPIVVTVNNTTIYARGRNAAGNYSGQSTITITNIEEGVANKPMLAPGMTAKIWNTSTSTWDTVTDPDNNTNWYNYTNKEWANAQTADGSMWVWIPRYVYKISSGWHQTSTTGIINIQFSQGINDLWNSNRTVNTGSAVTTSNNAWTTHPAFTFGTTELTGIWVAKFMASGSTTNPDFKPGITVLDMYNSGINGAYTASRNMETNSRYGWGTTGSGLDTHLIKNVEWGAVAYLSKSSYGKNTIEITKNNTTITGGGTGTGYISNVAQTTTGNIYGIYDMSSIKGSFVAAYRNDVSLGWGNNLINAPAQYKDVYTPTTLFSTTSPKGHAMYEIAEYSGAYAWFYNYLVTPDYSNGFCVRGGEYWNQNTPKTSGIFAMYNTYGGNTGCGFIPVIVVNSGL
jgi:hypothetical protein